MGGWTLNRSPRCVRCLLPPGGWSGPGRSPGRCAGAPPRRVGCCWSAPRTRSPGISPRTWTRRAASPAFPNSPRPWSAGDPPPHLRVGLQRLEAAQRGEALFVVAPEAAPVPLLERVSDARKAGAVILALDQGDRDLEDLAHESLTVRAAADPITFDAAQHLVSAAAGEPHGSGQPAAARPAQQARQTARHGQRPATGVRR